MLSAVGVLVSLIFLYGVGWADRPVLPVNVHPLDSGQIRTLEHIWTCSLEFVCSKSSSFLLEEEVKNLVERKVSYAGTAVSVKRDLIASRVIPVWPKVGKACVAPFFNFVDSSLQAELLDTDAILLPESEWPKTTPKSKVYASDSEWYDICRAGYERGMLGPIPEDEIFVNNLGDKVLQGAMGVDKIKEVDGIKSVFLRFICILCPINSYMRQIGGDSWSLPQCSLLNTLILNAGEYIWQDGEDLESCFNLFYLPPSWWKYFAFSKQVAATAFKGVAGVLNWVVMKALPMGWINSVALIQNFIRNLVFKHCHVSPSLEVNPRQRVVRGDAVVTCMDGFDFFIFHEAPHAFWRTRLD